MANNNVDPQLPILSVIEVTSPGPMGPTGPIGPPGSFPSTGSYSLTGSINVSGSFQLDGEVFISGSFTGSYLHIQGTPLATWTVTHNLQSEYPVVVTYDLNKKQIMNLTKNAEMNYMMVYRREKNGLNILCNIYIKSNQPDQK
jgi:hypothetical protein